MNGEPHPSGAKTPAETSAEGTPAPPVPADAVESAGELSTHARRRALIMANQASQPRAAGANATIVIAVIAVALSIYWLRGLIAPLLVAVFMLIVIGGLSRTIRNRAPKIGRTPSMILALVVIMIAFAVIAWVAYDNISRILANAEQYAASLNETFAQVQTQFGVTVPTRLEAMLSDLDLTQYVGTVAAWMQTAVTSTGFMLIYLGFMMASGRSFQRKMIALTGARAGLEESQAVFDQIREAVASYIWVQTATGAIIAVGSWLTMWALGVPNPIFWAFIVFITSYVPIVGGIAGVFLPVLFMLAVSGDFGVTLLLLAILQTIQLSVGNVLQPRMQSDSLNIDPIVVLLSLALWGVLLGPVGAFLSTPLTVTAMLILAQSRNTLWMAILLSADSRPAAVDDDDD